MRERELTRRIREFFRLGSGDVQTQVGGSAYNPAAVAITGGTVKVDDGATGAAQSLGFASAQDGWYRASTGIYEQIAGVDQVRLTSNFLVVPNTMAFTWSASATISGSGEISLVRDAANTVALKNGNASTEYRVYAGNGGYLSNVKSVTESLTIAAAATTVSATSIPAGAILIGVGVRVTTIIPTAATFTVTTTVGGTTLNTAAISTAAGSTDPGTAAGTSYRAAATTVTITPNLTPGTATGVVRLHFYYLQVTPPTS